MGRYETVNKVVYPRKDLDPLLVEYLEKWSGRRLTKLKKVSPEGAPFVRWRLEGIRNISYKNNTGNKLSLLHSALRLPLQEMFGDSLLHVGTEVGGNDLILDFKELQDVFKEISKDAYETYKEIPPSTFRSKEEKLIRIPYIRIIGSPGRC